MSSTEEKKESEDLKKPFFVRFINKCRHNIPFAISFSVFVIAFIVFVVLLTRDLVQENQMKKANSEFEEAIRNAELSSTPQAEANTPTGGADTTATAGPTATEEPVDVTPEATYTPTPTFTPTPSPAPEMTAGGKAAYELNNDYVGWLELLGDYTNQSDLSSKNRINYPVFQTFDDPATPYDANDTSTNESWFYLTHDANKKANQNGAIFIEENCRVGVGTAENDYENGEKPSANIIIYGHNVVSYKMFGALKQYWKSTFWDADQFFADHHTFSFTTCYEYREYEIISYFEDAVPTDDTYYFGSFIECYTQEDFDKWYSFIKSRSVRDIDVTAEFGDEFITLVTCATADDSPRRTIVIAVRTK